MPQINLKISPEEHSVLSLYAEQHNIPLATAFRTIVTNSFEEWRTEYLISQYCSGHLGFKKAWKLSGLSFNEWLVRLEQSECELEMPESIEMMSREIASELDPRKFLKQ